MLDDPKRKHVADRCSKVNTVGQLVYFESIWRVLVRTTLIVVYYSEEGSTKYVLDGDHHSPLDIAFETARQAGASSSACSSLLVRMFVHHSTYS